MSRRINRTYFVIPVVYAGVILLLLFLQFSGGEVFVERLGPLVLRANIVTDPRNQEGSLAHVRVEYEGLAFDFDAEKSVMFEEEDGRQVSERLVSYENLEDGFALQFANGAELRFLLTDETGEELHIKPTLPESSADYRSIQVPFALAGGAKAEDRDGDSVVPITFHSSRYLLAPPARAAVDPDSGVIRLPGNVPTQTVRYSAASEDSREPILTLFDDGTLSVSDSVLEEEISDYVDRSYRGWQRRFNGGSGTWLNRDGSSRFDERILTAFLSEAWQRDEYTQAFNAMRRAADLHATEISLLSAPFLGNLREIRSQYLEADQQKSEQLLSMIQAGDLGIFLTEDVGTFGLNRGTPQLRDALVSFVERLDPQDADVYQAIGMLRSALYTEFPTDRSREAFNRLTIVADSVILPKLVQVDEGFLLETVAGQVDVLASLEGGIALNALAQENGTPLHEDVGRTMMLTVLSLADENGFLPRVLLASGRTIQGQDGSFALESVYPRLVDNPAYPRLVPLYELFGEGSWLWTVADVTAAERQGNTVRFSLRYPRNRTHFLLFQGVPPFRSMELFGQLWRDDPNFEAYGKGRHYNQRSDTLLVKYTDNSVSRDIVLAY